MSKSPESLTGVVTPYFVAEVVNRFGSRPDPGRERARFPLQDCQAHAFRAAEPDTAVPIQVLDLGFAGLGFTSRNSFMVEELIQVAFPAPGIADQRLACRILHSHPLEGGIHHVGAVFETLAQPSPQESRNT